MPHYTLPCERTVLLTNVFLSQVRQPSKSTSALDRPIAVAPDARIRIEYLKTNDGASWIQRTIDMKTGLQIHNYVNGVGKMTGYV